MMYKILFAAAVAVAVSAMLGWIAGLQDAANSAYKLVYGYPPAHPHGDTTQHLNDWLAFLPDDPMTRGVIAAVAILGLLVFGFIVNLLGIRWSRFRLGRRRQAEARARTVNSYRKPH
jgi:hypothetical protein